MRAAGQGGLVGSALTAAHQGQWHAGTRTHVCAAGCAITSSTRMMCATTRRSPQGDPGGAGNEASGWQNCHSTCTTWLPGAAHVHVHAPHLRRAAPQRWAMMRGSGARWAARRRRPALPPTAPCTPTRGCLRCGMVGQGRQIDCEKHSSIHSFSRSSHGALEWERVRTGTVHTKRCAPAALARAECVEQPALPPTCLPLPLSSCLCTIGAWPGADQCMRTCIRPAGTEPPSHGSTIVFGQPSVEQQAEVGG